MLSTLKRHLESPGGRALRVQADVTRPDPAVVSLRYLVTGDVQALSLPPPGPPERTDGLWKSTCFEAFLAAEEGGYYEFNLAPSRRWAAYRFRAYREGVAFPEPLVTPPTASRTSGGQFELRATLYLEGLPGLAAAEPWRLGISAVLEEAGGALSYWALAHPPGKPDFHHPDSFALELP